MPVPHFVFDPSYGGGRYRQLPGFAQLHDRAGITIIERAKAFVKQLVETDQLPAAYRRDSGEVVVPVMMSYDNGVDGRTLAPVDVKIAVHAPTPPVTVLSATDVGDLVL